MTDMCISAANYIIRQVNTKEAYRGVIMTSKRLQKLLFFSDVVYMVRHPVKVRLFAESMFDDEFYAWQSGPVIPSVYDTFMVYQSGIMFPYNEKRHTLTNKKQQKVIDEVLEATKDLSTAALIEESHVKGGPWDRVYDKSNPQHDDLIPKLSIYRYYRKQNYLFGIPLKRGLKHGIS